MNLKGILLLCLMIVCSLGNLAMSQVVVPFHAPDSSQRRLTMAGRIKATLKYGYLKDNPEAESLRERIEYNRQGMPETIYGFGTAGGVERKETYVYDQTGLRILQANIEILGNSGDVEESLFYRFDPKGKLLEYHRESRQDGYSGQGNTYDPDGRLLVKQFFEKDRLPGETELYAYDTKGNNTSAVKRDIGGDVALLIQKEYSPEGRLTKETHLHEGRMLLYSFRFQYDSQGRLIRKEKLGRAQEVGSWESFSHNALGMVTEHQVMEQGESRPVVEKSTYDAKNRLREYKVIDSDEQMFQWYRYSYDSTGRGVGFEKLHEDGSPSMENLTVYDTNGRRKESRVIYHDGSENSRTEYRYDGYGLIMEEKHTSTNQEQAVFWFVHERY